jgi:hypothetical protein
MTLADALLLFPAALVAGALNAVAGGGSFISFPSLLFTGVPAIPANATNTVALWPGSVASVKAYWRAIRVDRRLLALLSAASLAGGGAGALLLLRTPERTFLSLLPWLLLFATLLFAFGGRVTRRIRRSLPHRDAPGWPSFAAIALIQLVIATYGGYFGGGIGIMMLAALALTGLSDIHEMNGLKTLLASLINGVAVGTFALSGVVAWPQAALMVAGAIAGGYGGAWYAQRVDPRWVRRLVILTGAAMTAYFFWKA